jgi:hypothetical protein
MGSQNGCASADGTARRAGVRQLWGQAPSSPPGTRSGHQTAGTSPHVGTGPAQARKAAGYLYRRDSEKVRLVADRQTFTLTPDAGEELAKAFISETDLPLTVRNAVAYGESDVSLSVLSDWGERAHISAPSGKKEARLLAQTFEVLTGGDVAADGDNREGQDDVRRPEGRSQGLALVPLPDGMLRDLRVALHVWTDPAG